MKVLHIGEYVVGGVATYLNELATVSKSIFRCVFNDERLQFSL